MLTVWRVRSLPTWEDANLRYDYNENRNKREELDSVDAVRTK
jgi:hypothetical protein